MSSTPASDALSVEAALAAELEAIYGAAPASQEVRDIQKAHFDNESAALCLSGGGVRSAAFTLGVLQGLAKRGLLKRFQYLSTVSGGGYTGGLLAAWIYRAQGGIAEVETELATRRPVPPPEEEGQRKTEAPRDPVWWVRRFANYLSPRLGLLSLDTWTLVATYLRNLLLNWLVLIPFLVSIVCVPFVFRAMVAAEASDFHFHLRCAGLIITVIGLFVLRWRTYAIGKLAERARGMRFDIATVLLLWAGAILVTTFRKEEFGSLLSDVVVIALGVVVSAVLGIVLIVLDMFSGQRRRGWWDRLILFGAFVTTMILSGLAVALWQELFPSLEKNRESDSAFYTAMTILAPPAWLLLLALPEVLFVGMAAKLSDDNDREWWARTAAQLLRSSVVWIVAGAVVLVGPRVLQEIASFTELPDVPALLPSLAALLGGLLTRYKFVSAMGATEGDQPPRKAVMGRRWGEIAFDVICVVLIVFIFVGIAYYVEQIIDAEHKEFPTAVFELGLALVFAGIAAMFGVSVQVNRYSLHAMYRDRLIRTFLAASRWKRALPKELELAPTPASAPPAWIGRIERPIVRRIASALAMLPLPSRLRFERQPPAYQISQIETRQFENRVDDRYTGFDRDDNPYLHWLLPTRRGGRLVKGSEPAPQPGEPVRAPFLVVNCALNMVGDRDLFVQERKAESFTFTPMHAGSARTGYREIHKYTKGGITLGTAMTISGAAVSPNAGYRSSPAITFLMTLFNARLGWWLGNPRFAKPSGEDGPVQALKPLVSEMLGRTHSGGNWVFLSDGGHFENLGLYEMVRRGCRHIIVIDASADPSRSFDDLGNAIRKIRIDLGVEIRQNQAFTIGTPQLGKEGRYVALFDIDYPWAEVPAGSGSDSPMGRLLYLKTALYDGNPLEAPRDVVEYSRRSPQFPHEPTSDQFFKESQFESYRALGEHEIRRVIGRAGKHLPWLFTTAVEHIKSQATESEAWR